MPEDKPLSERQNTVLVVWGAPIAAVIAAALIWAPGGWVLIGVGAAVAASVIAIVRLVSLPAERWQRERRRLEGIAAGEARAAERQALDAAAERSRLAVQSTAAIQLGGSEIRGWQAAEVFVAGGLHQ